MPTVVKATNTESPLDPKEFKEFKLKRVEPYNWNTNKCVSLTHSISFVCLLWGRERYVFELPNNEASLLPVASLVYIKAPEDFKDKNGKPVARPYTPTSASDKPGELEFVIKKYDNGMLSKYIADNGKPGSSFFIKGPIPKLPWKCALPCFYLRPDALTNSHTVNEYENVGMVAGGSGMCVLIPTLFE